MPFMISSKLRYAYSFRYNSMAKSQKSLQDPFFSPYISQLARLAFLASAIHQAVFTLFSSLPFSVGQVSGWGEPKPKHYLSNH